MSIAFPVDDVEPVHSRLTQVSLREAASRAISTEVRVVSHDALVVEDLPIRGRPLNQLVACVHRAFAEHRPLTLSPDHVWLAIAQGFSIHVDTNAEKLRERFVRHEGQVRLTTTVLSEPQSASEWAEVISGWTELIGEHVGPGLIRLLDCDFSTTTDVERAAARVVAMSAFKKYFDFQMLTICGIPSVTLEGSIDDWKSLRRRLDVLEEYDLKWWLRCVRPVADQLVASAEGRPDRDFWRSIYKPREVYAGTMATGWLMRLFPYLADQNGFVRSPAAEKEKGAGVRDNPWVGPEISPSAVPSGLNSALASVVAPERNRSLTLFSGFLGYRQTADGSMRPEVAWGVAEAPRVTVAIDALLSLPHCTFEPPAQNRSFAVTGGVTIPAEFVEFYERCDGLSCGDLVILPSAQLRPVVHRENLGIIVVSNTYGLTFGSFAGRSWSYVQGARGSHPVVFFEGEASSWEPEDIPVVAESFGDFLVRAASREPLIPIGTLYERLPETSEVLRRVLRRAEGRPLDDLSKRERRRLVMNLSSKVGSPAQREFWWQSLRQTLKLVESRETYFGERRSPFEISKLMGDET